MITLRDLLSVSEANIHIMRNLLDMSIALNPDYFDETAFNEHFLDKEIRKIDIGSNCILVWLKED